MKYIIILLLSFPTALFAQEKHSSIGLSGGGEYHAENTHAWNLELSYHDRIGKTQRFWTEFGVNYSVLEYKGDSGNRLDTSTLETQVAYGSYYNGFSRFQHIHYARSSFLRFQAGANFTVIDRDKVQLSAGVNLLSQVLVNHQEHGQRVYIPHSDTLPAYDGHYYVDSQTKEVTLGIQPHLDASYSLLDDLYLTARLSFYDILFRKQNIVPSQVNLGIRYYL